MISEEKSRLLQKQADQIAQRDREIACQSRLLAEIMEKLEGMTAAQKESAQYTNELLKLTTDIRRRFEDSEREKLLLRNERRTLREQRSLWHP